jgi:hypothetical protein
VAGLQGIFSFQTLLFSNIFWGLGLKMLGIFYAHFVYFMIIWHILWPFSFRLVFSPVFVFCTKKNLATLSSGEND